MDLPWQDPEPPEPEGRDRFHVVINMDGNGRWAAGIFARAFLQISSGVLAGSGLAAPLRRALRIDPTEALRMEG